MVEQLHLMGPIEWARAARGRAGAVVVAVAEAEAVGLLAGGLLPGALLRGCERLSGGRLALLLEGAPEALHLAAPPRSAGSRTDGNLLPW